MRIGATVLFPLPWERVRVRDSHRGKLPCSWPTTFHMKLMRLAPIHPGEVPREEFTKPLGLSSNALDVTPARINEIVRERRGIGADTALRLACFLRTDVQSWMNLQTHYLIQCAEDAVGSARLKLAPRKVEGLAA